MTSACGCAGPAAPMTDRDAWRPPKEARVDTVVGVGAGVATGGGGGAAAAAMAASPTQKHRSAEWAMERLARLFVRGHVHRHVWDDPDWRSACVCVRSFGRVSIRMSVCLCVCMSTLDSMPLQCRSPLWYRVLTLLLSRCRRLCRASVQGPCGGAASTAVRRRRRRLSNRRRARARARGRCHAGGAGRLPLRRPRGDSMARWAPPVCVRGCTLYGGVGAALSSACSASHQQRRRRL
jgi:hypothetical protein